MSFDNQNRDKTPVGAFAWLEDQLSHTGAAAVVRRTPGMSNALEVRVHADRAPEICVLCCWHEPWTAGPLGIESDVAMSALYVLELLDHACRAAGPSLVAHFIADDNEHSRTSAFAAGRAQLAEAPAPVLAVVAAGCAPGGGLAVPSTAGTRQPLTVPPALPRLTEGLDPDVIEALEVCAKAGITACVVDPAGRDHDLWPATELYRTLAAAARGEEWNPHAHGLGDIGVG
ncbi:hypothetical protein ACTU45_31430 [Streptomyces sp. 24-1644]|uniref:hypothetical protein n=1 Tax=Streptomyces sp. 24-1644 TaxID=3457315 RepID=UPI003FA73900